MSDLYRRPERGAMNVGQDRGASAERGYERGAPAGKGFDFVELVAPLVGAYAEVSAEADSEVTAKAKAAAT